MAFKTQVLKIMDSKFWKKDIILNYKTLRRAIIEQLEFTDKRTIAKWIGHEKITWKKQRTTMYHKSYNKKQVEWEKGLLEEFRFIEKVDKEEVGFEYMEEYEPYFKLLRDKSYFTT
jgi:hypothetical protein